MSRLTDDRLEVPDWWGDDVFAFALCSVLAMMFSVSLFIDIDKVSTVVASMYVFSLLFSGQARK
jgi:hypothetical protein